MNLNHSHNHNHGAMSMVNSTMSTMMNSTMSMMSNHHNHTTMTGMGSMTNGHEGHQHGMGNGMNGGDQHGMNHGDMHMSGHSMKMYFHTGVSEYVLFESCYTDSNKEMIAACIVVFFVAILYEGLKFVRETLLQKSLQSGSGRYSPDIKNANQEDMVMRGPSASISKQMLSCNHAMQTILHIVQIFISYCLMLVFMTYNVWLCVAVVLGAGIGYFGFGWKRAVIVDSNEHCH